MTRARHKVEQLWARVKEIEELQKYLCKQINKNTHIANLWNKEQNECLREMSDYSNNSQRHTGPITISVSNKCFGRIAIPCKKPK